MNNYKFVFLGFLLIGISSFSQNQVNWRKGILIDEFIFETAPYPYSHSATIAETPEGLVAAWYGGTDEGEKDVSIYLSRMIDSQWTTPVVVADGYRSASLRYPTWNPVLYQYPGGDLLLFYKVGSSPSTWWGELKRSKDNGKTWGEIEILPEGIIGPVKNKPVLLANGSLLCGSSTEDSGWKIHFEITSDTCKTWTKTSAINNGSTFPAIQPTILTYSDGRIQMLGRTKTASIGESWSTDNGKTWSAIKNGSLPQNSSGIDGVTLADGRQVLVYNHVIPPAGQYKGVRNPLNVALSNDGASWYAAAVLAEKESADDEWYAYPSVIQSSDGYVHIVYTWRRTNIRYLKIDPKELYSIAIVDKVWPKNNTSANLMASDFDEKLELYPNPVSGSFKVQYYSNAPCTCEIIIADLQGHMIIRQSEIAGKGTNNVMVDVSSLNDGGYILVVKNKNGSQTMPFVKK